MVDKKLEAFNKNKIENYKASCRLEGLKIEAAPHPDNHARYEVRICKDKERIVNAIKKWNAGIPLTIEDVGWSDIGN